MTNPQPMQESNRKSVIGATLKELEQILHSAASTIASHGLEYLGQPIDLMFIKADLLALLSQEYSRGRRDGGIEELKKARNALWDVETRNFWSKTMDTSKVTRFEIIDHRTGGSGMRSVIAWDDNLNLELLLQDDDRTLKVRLTDRKDNLDE